MKGAVYRPPHRQTAAERAHFDVEAAQAAMACDYPSLKTSVCKRCNERREPCDCDNPECRPMTDWELRRTSVCSACGQRFRHRLWCVYQEHPERQPPIILPLTGCCNVCGYGGYCHCNE